LKFQCCQEKLIIAVGDADGFLNFYSLVNGALLQRLQIAKDVAVTQVVFKDDTLVCGLENGTVAVVALEITF
jgi:uncharacterized protein GlcG (DUF336 family)